MFTKSDCCDLFIISRGEMCIFIDLLKLLRGREASWANFYRHPHFVDFSSRKSSQMPILEKIATIF